MIQLYKRILRGHVVRLIKRGRPREEARSDACFLVALPTAANIYSAALIMGLRLPNDRPLLLAGWMLLWGASQWFHRGLVKAWTSELEVPSQRRDGGFTDNALSIVYSVGSILGGFVVFAITRPFE